MHYSIQFIRYMDEYTLKFILELDCFIFEFCERSWTQLLLSVCNVKNVATHYICAFLLFKYLNQN